MTNLINALINDEAGFIVSAELVLVASIAVLGMVVGLSEVAATRRAGLSCLIRRPAPLTSWSTKPTRSD